MCKKRYLVLFSILFLVTSQAYCGSFGWSFLRESKQDSSVSQTKVEEPIIVEEKTSNETPVVLDEKEDLVMEKSLARTQTQTTTTYEDENQNWINYFKANEAGIQKLSQRLDDYEKSSILNKNEIIEQLIFDFQDFKQALEDSNVGLESASQLLEDYDKALMENTRLHFGVGVSGIYNVERGYSGYLDLNARKNNVQFNIGVGYPIDEELFENPSFDYKKLDYKVGLSWEF